MRAFGYPMGAIDPSLVTAIISASGQTASAIATSVAAGKQAEAEMLRARRKGATRTAAQVPVYTAPVPAPAAQQSSAVPWAPILLVGLGLMGFYLATRHTKPRQSA